MRKLGVYEFKGTRRREKHVPGFTTHLEVLRSDQKPGSGWGRLRVMGGVIRDEKVKKYALFHKFQALPDRSGAGRERNRRHTRRQPAGVCFVRHVFDTGTVPVAGVSSQVGLHQPDLLSILAHTRPGTPHPAHRDARSDARTHRARKETLRAHRVHLPLRAPSTAHQNRVRPKASRPRQLVRASLPCSPFHLSPPDTPSPVPPSSESMPHSRRWPSLSARFAVAPPPRSSLTVTGHAQEPL